MSDADRPRLRAVEPVPVQIDGRRLVALRDPEGFAEETALVHPGVLPILALFDGTRSLADVQAHLALRGAPRIAIESLRGLADSLDRCLLLDNDRFRAERTARELAFLESPVRDPAHAGGAYPEDAEGARAFLDGMLAGGPAPAPAPLARLIAPHIDLRLGGDVYGHAHRALRASGRPDVAVVLGVCHAPAEARFMACRKDFATPLGLVRHHGPFLDELERRFGRRMEKGAYAHKDEHSVEFQALWLAHLWPGDPPPMVPLLVGSFHEFVLAGASPGEDPEVAEFVGALRAAIAAVEGRVAVIASVDLAHKGPRYGDPEGLDAPAERALGEADAALLRHVAGNDAEGFFDEIRRDRNARNVCGVAPIYVTLKLGEGAGTLLRYAQGRIDPETRSVVSYAAVAFPS